MHPTHEELRRFVEDGFEDSARKAEITHHVNSCEFCREFCENHRLLAESLAQTVGERVPDKALRLADRLFEQAQRGRIIDLEQLVSDTATRPMVLAADGQQEGSSARVRSLVTLCSEDPEIVLRLMRDLDRGTDYLQLIADDPELVSQVMVQLPELGREFLTDTDGKAVLEGETGDKLEQLKWQIKMPDAIFSLEPLKYDPDRVEYTEEVTLETEHHDRISVRFEGKTEGKQLSIRILELDGSSEFEAVRVTVSQENHADTHPVSPGEVVEFGPLNTKSTINIRLFA